MQQFGFDPVKCDDLRGMSPDGPFAPVIEFGFKIEVNEPVLELRTLE